MAPLPDCILATANLHKVGEIRAVLAPLGWHLVTARERGVEEEIPETGDTLEANAVEKALYVARRTGSLALADDTGLEVDLLEGRPGVYSSRYAGPGATYAQNVEKLLRELAGTSAEERTARFRTVVALARPGKILVVAEGKLEGRITHGLRGEGGFGYDPVFLVPELGRTLAELTLAEKNRTSHRARALAEFVARARSLRA
ncbi:MAG: RdgB/HAM1 family non-canonical purine NTP pyrophosphatase [Planctomycetes bacterium]|nr:RdgB/HAM1 family non-canonical purine NTP pyrophosphatase [Planctomycetota bacterium]